MNYYLHGVDQTFCFHLNLGSHTLGPERVASKVQMEAEGLINTMEIVIHCISSLLE